MNHTKNPWKRESFPVGSLGCNCTILYNDDTKEGIIIDPGNDAKLVIEKIKSLGLNISFFLHTHAHFDHIGETQIVHRSYASKGKRLLHKSDLFLYEALKQQGMFFGVFNLEEPTPLEGYLEHGDSFCSHLKVLHTPGHTPGSVCFYTEVFEKPLLFSGDTLFASSIGRTDLPGGNSDLIIKSIKNTLFQLPDETLIIAGHGASSNIYNEKMFNPYVGQRL